jgi:hypothetical protein
LSGACSLETNALAVDDGRGAGLAERAGDDLVVDPAVRGLGLADLGERLRAEIGDQRHAPGGDALGVEGGAGDLVHPLAGVVGGAEAADDPGDVGAEAFEIDEARDLQDVELVGVPR